MIRITNGRLLTRVGTEFYENGAVRIPIVATNHADAFYKKADPLWLYYTGEQSNQSYPNRLIGMPEERQRVLGFIIYTHNAKGLLHWGYNYYNNKHSYDVVDPYGTTDGGYWVPAGDTCLVYPGNDGTPYESIRLNALREAVDDMRALRAYEAKFGRAATEALIMDGVEGTFDFINYPTSPDYLINLRERIAKALA